MPQLEQFLAIIFGALVSAFVALLSNYLTGRMREQELKKETVYRPIFNELDAVTKSNGFAITHETKSVWDGIDNYSKMRLDKSLRQKIEAYYEKMQEARVLLNEQERLLREVRPKFADVLSEAFPKGVLTHGGKTIVLEWQSPGMHSVTMELINWARNFDNVVLDSQTSEELFKNLCNYPIAKGDQYQVFCKWNRSNPEIFANLLRIKNNVLNTPALKDIAQKVVKARGELVPLASEARRAVEKQVKKFW